MEEKFVQKTQEMAASEMAASEMAASEMAASDMAASEMAASEMAASEIPNLKENIGNMDQPLHSVNKKLQATVKNSTDLLVQLEENKKDLEIYRNEKKMLTEKVYSKINEKIEQRRLYQTAQNTKPVLKEINQNIIEKPKVTKLQDNLLNLGINLKDKDFVEKKLASKEEDSLPMIIYEITQLKKQIANLEQDFMVTELQENIVNLGKNLKDKDFVEKKLSSIEEDSLSSRIWEITKLKKQIANLEQDFMMQCNKKTEAIKNILMDHILENQEIQKKAEEGMHLLNHKLNELNDLYQKTDQDLKSAQTKIQKMETLVEDKTVQMQCLEKKYVDEKNLRKTEAAKWSELQGDLLVAVRVANQFKTDCEEQLNYYKGLVKDLNEQIAIMEELVREKENEIPHEEEPKESIKENKLNKLQTSEESLLMFTFSPVITSTPVRPQWNTVEREIIENIVKHTPYEVKFELSQDNRDPLDKLTAKRGIRFRRNALLDWLQERLANYPNIEIHDFSTSWADGLALCALFHTYLPVMVPYNTLSADNKQQNFEIAFKIAESFCIPRIVAFPPVPSQDGKNSLLIDFTAKVILLATSGTPTQPLLCALSGCLIWTLCSPSVTRKLKILCKRHLTGEKFYHLLKTFIGTLKVEEDNKQV